MRSCGVPAQIEERIVEIRVRGAADAIGAYRAVGRAGDDAAGGAEHLTRAAHRSREEMVRLGREGNSAMHSLRNGARMAAGAITAIAGSTAAVLAAQSVGLAAQRDAQIKGLTAIMGSADAAAAHFRELQRVAALPGVTLSGALELSQKFQTVGLGADLATKAVEELGNAVALTGGGDESLSRAALALQQIISNGRVMGEEINQLAEAIPQVRKVLTETFGTSSSEELRGMGIAAEDLVRLLIDGFGSLPRAEVDTFSNQLQNLKMAAQELMIAFGRGFTGGEGVGGLQTMATVLERLTPAAEAFGVAVAKALPGIIGFIERLSNGTTYQQIEVALLGVRTQFQDMAGHVRVLLQQAGATVRWFGEVVPAVFGEAGKAIAAWAQRLKPALSAAMEALRAWAKANIMAIFNPKDLLKYLDSIKSAMIGAFTQAADSEAVAARVSDTYARSLASLRSELKQISDEERIARERRQDALAVARGELALRVAAVDVTRQQTAATVQQTVAVKGLAEAQAEVAAMMAKQARVAEAQAGAFARGEMARRDAIARAAEAAVSPVARSALNRAWSEAGAAVSRGDAITGNRDAADSQRRRLAEYQRIVGGMRLDSSEIDRQVADAELRAQRLKALGADQQAADWEQEAQRLKEWSGAMSAAFERFQQAGIDAAGQTDKLTEAYKRRWDLQRDILDQSAADAAAVADQVRAAEADRVAREGSAVTREARRISIMMRGGSANGRGDSLTERIGSSALGNLGGGVDTILAEARLRGMADSVTRAVAEGGRGLVQVVSEAIRDGMEQVTRQAAAATRRAVAAA